MLLCNKHKIIIEEKEYYIDVLKKFNYRSMIDYYTYTVVIYVYKPTRLFSKFQKVWDWTSDWLDYKKYHGDIDKIINTAMQYFINNIKEQKYISENETKFKSL